MIYKKLTDEAKAAYRANPDHCPFCNGKRITVESSYTVSATEHAKIRRCEECNLGWDDVFVLTRVEEGEPACEACSRHISFGDEIEALNDGVYHPGCIEKE